MSLTDRERRILALVAQGKRDKEIARVVDLCPDHVKTCVGRALKKLGAHTRAHAVVMLLKEEI